MSLGVGVAAAAAGHTLPQTSLRVAALMDKNEIEKHLCLMDYVYVFAGLTEPRYSSGYAK